MMNKKSLVLLIFGIFIIIFIVPQIIHFLVYTPSPFGFIKPGEESQWIGFFGSVIGGSLTLAGVWWTLKYQDEKRKEDLAIQYKPLCSIEILDKGKEHFHINKDGYYIFSIPFRLKNIGRGEIYISDIIIKRKLNNDYIRISPYKRNIGLLVPSEYYDSFISFSLDNSEILSMREKYTGNIILSLKFTIIGKDLNKNEIDPLILKKEYFCDIDKKMFKPYYPPNHKAN